MPQRLGDGAERLDKIKAAHSVPAYIERCSHYFAICPNIQIGNHTTCDYSSWLARGFVRVELFSLLLARHNMPVIVVRGGDAAPFMISPAVVVSTQSH